MTRGNTKTQHTENMKEEALNEFIKLGEELGLCDQEKSPKKTDMKIYKVKIHLDVTLKNMVEDSKINATQSFEHILSHTGPIISAIENAIEKTSRVLNSDITKYIDKIEAKEIR